MFDSPSLNEHSFWFFLWCVRSLVGFPPLGRRTPKRNRCPSVHSKQGHPPHTSHTHTHLGVSCVESWLVREAGPVCPNPPQVLELFWGGFPSLYLKPKTSGSNPNPNQSKPTKIKACQGSPAPTSWYSCREIQNLESACREFQLPVNPAARDVCARSWF